MALGATAAKLLASLDLDTKPFERGIGRVDKSLGGMQQRFGTIGKVAAVGLGAAAGVGLVALGRGIRAGIDSLAQLETATTSVDGAIKQMGLTGQVTASQVATWANEIEASVGAAFDDKAITQAATTLIRFGKITPQNLRPALVVMTDLATKTGSVDSAASLLAKALADPEKAAGKLARSGVILTKQQQDQIKAMVKAGKAADAQAFLLDQLSKATMGAALASQGPYARSLSVLRDVTEDAERALGEGFLPVIEKVRDILTRGLAKPQTLTTLRDFGKGLAGGLDKLVTIATGLPWGSIGDAFKLVGQGSKAALDLFTGLPPWVQTAVLTGWGLNKLTGGGLGTIIGELGKGLIKGVLGMNAGVVNINAGVVNGAGGVPAAGAAAGAAKTGISTLGKVFLVGEAIGLVAAVVAVGQSISEQSTKQAQDIHTTLTQSLAGPQSVAQLQQKLAGIDEGIANFIRNPLTVLVAGDALNQLKAMRAEVVAALEPVKPFSERQTDQIAKAEATKKAVDLVKTGISQVRDESARAKIAAAGNALTIRNATATGSSQIVTAIERNRPIVNLDVKVSGMNVTVNKTYSNGDMGGGPSGKYQSGENQ